MATSQRSGTRTSSSRSNPWDKAISLYYWRGADKRFSSIEEWIHKTDDLTVTRSFDLYTKGGTLAVDKVYKFEEMDAALADITERLDLTEPLRMPDYRAKSTQRTNRKHYSEVLTPKERDLIATAFAREIALLGYSY